MEAESTERSVSLKRKIDAYLRVRIAQALEKYPGDDRASLENQSRIRDGLDFKALIQVAKESEGQIQIASHIAKGIHPDIKVKKATNLLAGTATLKPLDIVGSYLLPVDMAGDATGNGAFVKKIYELNRLLVTEFEGKSIYSWLKAGDQDVINALGLGKNDAPTVRALISLTEQRSANPATSKLAKQMYWLLDDSCANDDGTYHLLAPLYPTLLIHRMYLQLQDDRFSDEAKAARVARKEGTYHARPVREYSNLAIQKLSGAKPQNISQLNSERRGDNYLLASVPPLWKSTAIRPLFGVNSLFKVLVRRPSVRQQLRALRQFLESNPVANLGTRQRVRNGVEALLDELIQLQAELLTIDSGWSQSDNCDLPTAQRIWLDPEGQPVSTVIEDIDESIARDFARWVNAQLRNPLPVGDNEFEVWRKLAYSQFQALSREAA